MARRKSRAKREEEFFQGLAGLAAIILALGGYLVTHSLNGAVFGAILGLIIVLVIMVIVSRRQAERLKKSGISDIDSMEGI